MNPPIRRRSPLSWRRPNKRGNVPSCVYHSSLSTHGRLRSSLPAGVRARAVNPLVCNSYRLVRLTGFRWFAYHTEPKCRITERRRLAIATCRGELSHHLIGLATAATKHSARIAIRGLLTSVARAGRLPGNGSSNSSQTNPGTAPRRYHTMSSSAHPFGFLRPTANGRFIEFRSFGLS